MYGGLDMSQASLTMPLVRNTTVGKYVYEMKYRHPTVKPSGPQVDAVKPTKRVSSDVNQMGVVLLDWF